MALGPPLPRLCSTEEGVMTEKLKDVAAKAGISYRQANYWAAIGYIQAIPYRSRSGKLVRADDSKSGRIHRLELPEANILRTMARLVNAGIPVMTAAEIAREYVKDDRKIYELNDGIWLVVAPEEPEETT
jgi:hypothetical protein